MQVKLQRQKLYIDVRRLPVGHLARKLGVTSAKLREATKAMSVPLPPAGHWAAVRSGAAPSPTPLPEHAGPETFRIGAVPRESLVDWLMAAEVEVEQPSRKAPSLPPLVKIPNQVAGPRYILLREWAAAVFGETAPHQNTLLKWVHEGRIQPPARKIGRCWWVTPAADYVED